MEYQAFKDHLVTFLWKEGDQTLIDSLDNLIRMADSELNVALNLESTSHSSVLEVKQQVVQLPSEVTKIRSVVLETATDLKELKYCPLPRLLEARRSRPTEFHSIYYNQNHLMYLAGPFGIEQVTTTPILVVTYGPRLPNYKENNASWFADEHLSLYTYAVLKHASAFLREDERVPLWEAQYEKLVMLLREEDAFHGKAGVYTDMPLPRPSSPIRRR